MGSFLSIQSGDKQRRSNRLSKPPSTLTSRSASCRSPRQASGSISPVAPNLNSWQDSLSATSNSISSPVPEPTSRRPQSFPSPSVSQQSEAQWPANGPGKSQPISGEPNKPCLRSGTSSSGTLSSLCRRASFQPSRETTFQPTTLRSEPPSPLVQPGQPQRSYSVHSPPNGTRSAIYQSSLEEATSSNTHFMVDSPGFSLIRRRSLLTRPGIATRRSVRDSARRCPSPIGQEFGFPFNHTDQPSRHSQWPLTDHDDAVLQHTNPLSQLRPPTPSDFEYTHLGALKLGSLRVVNGSASPCPSDRSRLRPCSPAPEATTMHATEQHHSREHLAHIDRSHIPASYSDKIDSLDPWGPEIVPNFMHEGSSNGTSSSDRNVPGLFKTKPSASVLFSFEKSPTIAISHGSYAKEAEDEGISISDDDKPSDFRGTLSHESSYPRRLSHSQRKVDSGYSSAASVRSLQDNRTRASMDSQESAQRPYGYRRFTLGGSKDPDRCNIQSCPELSNQLPMNRHLSLHSPRVCSRGDSNGWLANMSTMCHETPQLRVDRRPRSLSYAAPQNYNRTVSSPQYCAQLRHLEFSPGGDSLPSVQRPQTVAIQMTDDAASNIQLLGDLAVLDAEPGYNRGTMGTETTNRRRINCDTNSNKAHKGNIHQAASAKKLVKKTSNVAHDQAPQTLGLNAAAQCLESEIEALLTPTSQRPEKAMTVGCVYPESPRGRARSRTIGLERRMSVQQQKPPNIYVASSPFICH